MKILALSLLFATSVCALPDSPIPKVAQFSPGFAIIAGEPKPVAREPWIKRPEALMLFQSMAVIADGVTTARFPGNIHEANPIVRPLIGYPHPTAARMVPLGIAEVGASYLLAKRFPKLRWLQIGLTATHAGAAAHNLTLE